ncbi:cytochrome-c oxidase, cbb3-type subunit III [Primorskyibacter aestuariivivens]|uniref:cytochrome-c oxidase, cbb3-type subunit III n=1 Tax=Primorskyibacter aestuariivivens TaxID=1888912 RepID=UPI002300E29D|nr:cytochrome-c oxidase, cbb3-type subunit III [Primorskyibacter aestuariivivens]MDA7427370.1 cytochrome-c oxidase, cbb3-type subunit III [Primorskyibacter aestuariivivens]
MSTDNKNDDLDYETTGHEWDGIKEYNKPMPKWWLYTFYATIVWGIGYTIAYPAWPGITSATAGVLGYSTRAEVAADIKAVEDANAAINAKLVETELTAISEDPELLTYANNAGAAVFRTWCAQCHGSGAAGAQASGYPNLLDDDWLWGGDIEAIHETIAYGIRNEENDNARFSQMPAFGDILEEQEVASVVNYVMSLSGEAQDASLVAAGEEIYLDNCAACHMDEGTGDRFQGAPNLTDAIWLYGGSYDALMETVTNSRYGVMPPWEGRLSEAEIRAVATYVHGLGGGEATPE